MRLLSDKSDGHKHTLTPYDRGILGLSRKRPLTPPSIEYLMSNVAACTLLRVTSAFGSLGTYYMPLSAQEPPRSRLSRSASGSPLTLPSLTHHSQATNCLAD